MGAFSSKLALSFYLAHHTVRVSLCPKKFVAFLLEEKGLGFVAREYMSYMNKL
jgi:hypothetical protein